MNDEPTDASWKRHEGLYSAVGQAISFWASMEGKVVQIAAMLVGTTDRKAGLLFYSIMNFFSWLTIIDELFAIEPNFNSLKEEWGAISNKLRGMNDIRVRLAHHTVWDYPEFDDAALRPGRHDARAKSQKHVPLTHAEIAKFAASIIDMEDRLFKLWEKMFQIANLPPSPLRGTFFAPEDGPPNPTDSPQQPTPTEP